MGSTDKSKSIVPTLFAWSSTSSNLILNTQDLTCTPPLACLLTLCVYVCMYVCPSFSTVATLSLRQLLFRRQYDKQKGHRCRYLCFITNHTNTQQLKMTIVVCSAPVSALWAGHRWDSSPVFHVPSVGHILPGIGESTFKTACSHGWRVGAVS